MAVTNNSYQIELKVNNTEIDSLSVSFSLRDSIFMTLPELVFTVSDNSMIYQEYGAFLEAEKISILFKYNNEITQLKNNFTVSHSDILQPKNPNNLGGNIDVYCVQEWFRNQNINSFAYQGTVSSIVEQIITPFFPISVIENTTTSGIFYQALVNNMDFIETELKKRASSPQVSSTPFVNYVDNHGFYNFRSMKNLSNQTPIPLYTTYKPNQNNRYLIESIIKKGTPSRITKKKRSRKIFNEDTTTGLYVETADNISNYPIEPVQVPIIDEGLLPIVTDYQILGRYDGKSLIDKDILDSVKNYTMIDTFPLDRLVITTQFLPELVSGKSVTINLNFEERNSLYYGGTWIIEESTHFWNHETNRASTRIVVFKKDINTFPANYNNANRVVKG